MACVIRVQNSISSVSSLCLSTLCTLLNIFSAEVAGPPKRTKIFAALFRCIVLVVAFIDESQWYGFQWCNCLPIMNIGSHI
eukprot:CCRYP_012160-RB/>CCRYP_012160-RB protein AED:0.46 eAED:0.46 QI:25/1/1/1/0/0/3/241/80